MNTKTILKTFVAALLLASASAMYAQDDDEELLKAYISFGQNFAHGHAHDMTETTWGGPGAFLAEFGVQFKHNLSGLTTRINGGYTKVLGDPIADTYEEDWDGSLIKIPGKPTYDLLGVFCGIDLVYNLSSKITAHTGPTFHWWSVEKTTYHHGENPLQGDRGAKLGWRFGLGYEFNSTYRIDLTYTMTEWRSVTSGTSGNATGTYVPGFNPSLPAYFTLKGSYTF